MSDDFSPQRLQLKFPVSVHHVQKSPLGSSLHVWSVWILSPGHPLMWKPKPSIHASGFSENSSFSFSNSGLATGRQCIRRGCLCSRFLPVIQA